MLTSRLNVVTPGRPSDRVVRSRWPFAVALCLVALPVLADTCLRCRSGTVCTPTACRTDRTCWEIPCPIKVQ